MASVSSFTITNKNTFSVDVQAPNGTKTSVSSMGGATFSSYGTYTVSQAGNATTIYFTVNFPTTRILSTGTGTAIGDFLVSAVLN